MVKIWGYEYDWNSEKNTQERFIYVYFFLGIISRTVDFFMFLLIATVGVWYQLVIIIPIYFGICAGILQVFNVFYWKYGFPLFPVKDILERKRQTADFFSCICEIPPWTLTLIVFYLDKEKAMRVGGFIGKWWGQPIMNLIVNFLEFVSCHNWLIFIVGSLTLEPDAVTLIFAKKDTVSWKDIIFITLPSSILCIIVYSAYLYLIWNGFGWLILTK